MRLSVAIDRAREVQELKVEAIDDVGDPLHAIVSKRIRCEMVVVIELTWLGLQLWALKGVAWYLKILNPKSQNVSVEKL